MNFKGLARETMISNSWIVSISSQYYIDDFGHRPIDFDKLNFQWLNPALFYALWPRSYFEELGSVSICICLAFGPSLFYYFWAGIVFLARGLLAGHYFWQLGQRETDFRW